MKKIFSIGVMFLTATLLHAQNVGIGTLTPSFPLHVVTSGNVLGGFDGGNNSFIRFDENGVYRGYLGSFSGNDEDMDFGTGTSNFNGKVHLTSQGIPKLTIGNNGYVGINTTNPQWDLDVNGNMRLLGRLIANGSSGSSGQVLSSNGFSAPSWRTLTNSYENTTRFAAFFGQGSAQTGDCVIDIITYNLDPGNISISPGGIVLSRPGLYHFDISVEASYSFSSAPSIRPEFSLWLYTSPRPNPFYIINDKVMDGKNNNASPQAFGYSNSFSIDLHVEAGQTIRLYHSFGIGGGPFYAVNGLITGHLISP